MKPMRVCQRPAVVALRPLSVLVAHMRHLHPEGGRMLVGLPAAHGIVPQAAIAFVRWRVSRPGRSRGRWRLVHVLPFAVWKRAAGGPLERRLYAPRYGQLLVSARSPSPAETFQVPGQSAVGASCPAP